MSDIRLITIEVAGELCHIAANRDRKRQGWIATGVYAGRVLKTRGETSLDAFEAWQRRVRMMTLLKRRDREVKHAVQFAHSWP